jgi:hypothetical protein
VLRGLLIATGAGFVARGASGGSTSFWMMRVFMALLSKLRGTETVAAEESR